jgi:hypothetical protein
VIPNGESPRGEINMSTAVMVERIAEASPPSQGQDYQCRLLIDSCVTLSGCRVCLSAYKHRIEVGDGDTE